MTFIHTNKKDVLVCYVYLFTTLFHEKLTNHLLVLLFVVISICFLSLETLACLVCSQSVRLVNSKEAKQLRLLHKKQVISFNLLELKIKLPKSAL